MAQTQSSSYFSGLRDDLTGLAIDLVRARHIDSQLVDDERNIPDQADVRAGFTGDAFKAAPGGVPIGTWLFLGGAAALAVFAFKKLV